MTFKKREFIIIEFFIFLFILSKELTNEQTNDITKEKNKKYFVSDCPCPYKKNKIFDDFKKINDSLINLKPISIEKRNISNLNTINERNLDNVKKIDINNKSIIPQKNKIDFIKNISNFKILNPICKNLCEKEIINFNSINQITINEGDKLNVYPIDKLHNFTTYINVEEKDTKIALIILGNKNNTIIMNSLNKVSKRISEEILTLILDTQKLGKIPVNISANKGDIFTFYFQILKNNKNYKNFNIYLNENHYYYLLPKINYNFTMEYYNKSLTNIYELSLSSFKNINAKFEDIDDHLKRDITIEKKSIIINLFSENIKLKTEEKEEEFNEFSLIHFQLKSKKLFESKSYNFYLKKKKIMFHSYSNYSLENDDILNGFIFIIKKISGKLIMNKIDCKDKYNCSINHDIDKIEIKDSFYEIPIYPLENDKSSIIDYQNGISLECQDKDCQYNIIFYSLGKKNIIKYLKPLKKISYSFAIKNKKVININILTGDAYLNFTDDKEIDINTQIIGNYKRLILSGKVNNYKIFKFSITSTKEGAIYNLFSTDINETESILPLDMSGVESLYNDPKNITLINMDKEDDEKIENIGIFLNPINCYKFTAKLNTQTHSTQENYLNLITSISNKNKIELILTNYENNRKCLFFIGSIKLNSKKSFLTLPEGRTLGFELDNKIEILRTKFYYVFNSLFPSQLYLRISLINEIPIKINIDINKKNISYDLFKSKNILIIDSDNSFNLNKNKLYEIKITFEKIKGEDENSKALFDINIKTFNEIPKLLKQNEIFTDIVLNNNNFNKNINYYYTPINKNSEGEIKLNFKRGTGYIFGKFINLNLTEKDIKWENFIKEINNQKGLLNFNFYEQKLSFSTKSCKNLCYLFFGVKSSISHFGNNINDNLNYELFSEFDLIIKYTNNNTIDYINIPNNKYIINSLSNNQTDYYKYISYENLTEIIIEFKSDNCILKYSFENNSSNLIERNGKNSLTRISNEGNKILYINISSNNKYVEVSNISNFYKLKIYETNDLLNDIIIVDTNHPIYCEESKLRNNKDSYFCDYLISLENIYTKDTIIEISVEDLFNINTNNDISLYYSLYNSSTFTQKLIKKKLDLIWPNKTNCFNFSLTNDISIQINNYNNIEDLFLIIRVYIKNKSSFELHTFFHNNFIEKENPINIVPFPNEYQYLTCFNNNEIKINLPYDKEYNYNLQIISIYEEAIITINNETKLIGNGLIIENLNKQEILIKTDKSEDWNNEENKNKHSYYKFYLLYKKNFKNLEIIKPNKEYKFIYYNDMPIKFLIDINNTNFENDLYYYIYFSSLLPDITNKEPYNIKNDSFDINAFLVNENDLMNLSNYKGNKYSGIYDIFYHEGKIFIPSDIIKNIAKYNYLYILITIEPSMENNRNYNYIEGNIFAIEEKEKKINIPKNVFILNSFPKFEDKNNSINSNIKNNLNNDNNTNYHIYKLKFSNSDISRNKTVSLYSITEDIEMSLFKNDSNNITDYSDITKINGTEIKRIIINGDVQEIYLNIKCPKKDYIVNYVFKYNTFDSNSALFEIPYNKTIEYSKYNDSLLNLNIRAINFGSDYRIIYYIRIYEYNSDLEILNKSTSYSEITPYETYRTLNKINITLNIPKYIINKYFIDVIAEISKNEIHEYFPYEKIFPEFNKCKDNLQGINSINNDDKEKGNNNDNDEKNISLKLVFLLGSLIFILTIFILFILFRNYRKRSNNLEFKVEKIISKENKLFDEFDDDEDEDDNDIVA